VFASFAGTGSMSQLVADKPKKKDGDRRKPGRPPTDIETDSFCCRAALTMVSAYQHLARARGTKRAGTELLHAAEAHLLRMYRIVRDDPDSPLLNGAHVTSFLQAAETFFREAKIDPDRKAD
jgi:hypothetical protein